MARPCAGCDDGSMTEATVKPVRRNPATTWAVRGAVGALAVAAAAFALGETMAWPFLAAPMQRVLGDTLQRRVVLGNEAARPKVAIHLFGGVRLDAERIEIGAPAWSAEPHLLLARDARMSLRYVDLFRAARGGPLRIEALHAAALDLRIERRADGRASWQFGQAADTPDLSPQPARIPVFGRLQVGAGTLAYRDALLAAQMDATYALVDSSETGALDGLAAAPPASGAARAASGAASAGLQFSGRGSYRQQPLRVELTTLGVLPVVADDAGSRALPVTLEVRIGGASVSFRGTATDVLRFGALKGRFTVQGASLAAAGAPLGVTLPTTGPFRVQGLIAKDGVVWNTVVDSAAIGASRLSGAFTYDPRPRVPMLAGRLTGSKLLLADLGPVVGAPARKSVAVPDVAPEAATRRANASRVLPDREFDLPSLRAMDANVLVDIDNLDLGSSLLEPLKPLRTQLRLADGVLRLDQIEARTGQGRLYGTAQLDGRAATALWTADLRWADVRLERWIHQGRGADSPPYVTGRMSGQARVAGQGRSTAAILGSLEGGVRMQLVDGSVSHLAVEAAGLDIAQGLGLLLKGDDALPVECSVADFVAEKGLLKPRVLVLDTRDSTLWIDGSISLATEALDLRITTTPKDFSPLALRTPVRLRGSFSDPAVSLEPGRLATRVGAAALLALINPLAAILPFVDIGDSDDSKRGALACRKLSQRIAAQPLLPAPPKPAAKRAAAR